MDNPVTMKTYPEPVMTDVGSIMSVIIPMMREDEVRLGLQLNSLGGYSRAVPSLYYDNWQIDITLRYVGDK